MATLSASRRNSANSSPTTPRQSLSGTLTVTTIPRMSSLTEQENVPILNCDINSNIKINNSQEIKSPENDESTDNHVPLKVLKEIKNENSKVLRSRACSERSDSGISDCSSHLTSNSCTSTPLLGKKFKINEETENSENTNGSLILNNTNVFERQQSDESDIIIKGVNNNRTLVIESDETDEANDNDECANILVPSTKRLSIESNVDGKPPLDLKISEKIGSFNGNKSNKCK